MSAGDVAGSADSNRQSMFQVQREIMNVSPLLEPCLRLPMRLAGTTDGIEGSGPLFAGNQWEGCSADGIPDVFHHTSIEELR